MIEWQLDRTGMAQRVLAAMEAQRTYENELAHRAFVHSAPNGDGVPSAEPEEELGPLAFARQVSSQATLAALPPDFAKGGWPVATATSGGDETNATSEHEKLTDLDFQQLAAGQGFHEYLIELTVRRVLSGRQHRSFAKRSHPRPEAHSGEAWALRLASLLGQVARADDDGFPEGAFAHAMYLAESLSEARSLGRQMRDARTEMTTTLKKTSTWFQAHGSVTQRERIQTHASAVAERILEVTAPVLEYVGSKPVRWAENQDAAVRMTWLLRCELALQANHDGYPTHLGARAVGEWFRALVAPRLDPKTGHAGARRHLRRLGANLSPMSSLRAAAKLGAAFAATLPESPLATVHRGDVVGWLEAEWSGAFAWQFATEAFQRRTLGASRELAERAERELAVGLLLALRRHAAMTLVYCANNDRGRIEDVLARWLGCSARAEQLLAVPDEEAARRMLGTLTGLARQRYVQNLFDEDWHRNPRAQEYFCVASELLSLAHSESALLALVGKLIR
jgi:hypothetical protein